MKVSVVVPVYNTSKYLRDCVDSLVMQTYIDKEIILVDDGSTDDSGKICDEYAERYDCVSVIHQDNKKLPGARNTGLNAATGDYIAVIDSDDSIDHDMLEIIISEMEKTDSEVGVCGYQIEYKKDYKAKEKNKLRFRSGVINGNDDCVKSIYRNNDFVISGFVWNKVYKKEIIADVRFDESVAIIDDLVFVIQTIARTQKLCFIDLPMYHYRYVAAGATRKPNIPRFLQCLEGYKYIIKWAGDNAKACLDDLHCDYVFWNTKTAETMLKSYSEEAYKELKKNLQEERVYIDHCKPRIRLLAKSLLKSWSSYKIKAEFIYSLKQIYIKLKQ